MALRLNKGNMPVASITTIEVVDKSLAPNVSRQSFDLAVYRPSYSGLDIFRLVRWIVSGRPINGVIYTSAHEY